MARLWTAAFVLTVCCLTGADTPDLVPMPKRYQQTGGPLDVGGKTVFVEEGNRQCQIAATELALRVKELGGESVVAASVRGIADPGIYVLPISNPSARELAKALSLNITAADPGPQGYVVHSTENRVVVIGSDNVGTLYGAMTIRQMMESRGGGPVVIVRAEVYDRPDYRYRSSMSFARGIKNWATRDKDIMPACKEGMDWLMRFKVNIVSDYNFWLRGVKTPTPEQRAFLKELNRYAVDRGIYPGIWFHTGIVNPKVDKSVDPKTWDCINAGGKRLYCWSRTDMNRQKAQRAADFCRECNFRIMFLHPVDGGGIKDPEVWSRRCKQCRERWGDGERWKASIEQFNIWADAIKRTCPDLIFTSPIYPYAASYASRARFPDVDEATWRQNSVDYWLKVTAGVDPILIPQTWMAQRPLMDLYRQYFSGRPAMIYSHSFIPLSYFGTWHRYNKTNYYGNPRDIFTLNGGFDSRERWLNVFCTGEFTWNTNAPGSEYFTGLYYDPETDHTGPPEIIDEWVPRACRAFYGKEVGERIAPTYQVGVQPLYIMDPGYGIYLANKQRRRPLGAVDPTKKGQQALGQPVAPDLEDGPERMAAQVKATKRAMAALESALPYLDSLGKHRRKSFMYFYKRMPLWHLTARARHACYVSADLQRQGMYEPAVAVLEAGLKCFEADHAAAQKVLETTKREADLNYYGPVGKRGDVRPQPERIKALLLERLESAKVVLKPRRPGPIVRIGVHKGFGANGTAEFLDQFKNAEADVIDTLSLAVLDKYDCVFIMQTGSVSKDDYFFNLRRYVTEGGGGVLFQHDMCGFGRYTFGQKTPFPDICPHAVDRKDLREVVIRTRHPATLQLEPGAKLKHMYYDHIVPKPGDKAIVLVEDQDGAPIVVAGTQGHGKVIFDGNVNLTVTDDDVLLTDFNAVLAQGAVEWMTGVKLEKK